MGKGSGVAVSYGVGGRHILDRALLWLWPRLVATAPIGPLAWEPLYAVGVAQENGKKTKKKKKKKIAFKGSALAPFASLNPMLKGGVLLTAAKSSRKVVTALS